MTSSKVVKWVGLHFLVGLMGGKQSGVSKRSHRGALSSTLVGHRDIVLHCAFSPDGRLLATCSADHTIILWDTKKSNARSTLKGHKAEVTAVAFSPDSYLLVSSGKDARVILWDAKAGEMLQKAHKHHGAVLHCDYSPDDNTMFATASEDKTASVWQIAGPRMERRELVGHKDIVFQ